MNGGVALCVEVDEPRIRRRLETRYLDEEADDLDDAIARCAAAKASGRALERRRFCANAAEVLPRAAGARLRGRHRHRPDERARPAGRLRADRPDPARRPTSCGTRTPTSTCAARARSMAAHCSAMVGFKDRGAEVFDYGNSLRAEAKLGGFERAFDYPGFVPAYIRPLFCEGSGPFRWVALSGDPADIAATDRAVLEEFPDDERLRRWIAHGERAHRVPGPAGAHLLARLRRARTASACASTRWSRAAS